MQQHFGEILGKGGFGSVYRALDLETGGTVALKRVSKNDLDDEKQAAIEVRRLCFSRFVVHGSFLLFRVKFDYSNVSTTRTLCGTLKPCEVPMDRYVLFSSTFFVFSSLAFVSVSSLFVTPGSLKTARSAAF